MKKLFAIALTGLTIGTANAVDLSVYGQATVEDTHGGYGLALGEKFGPVHLALSADRSDRNGNAVDSYMVTSSYDVFKYGVVTVSAQVGAGYVTQERGTDGFAGSLGLGTSVAFTKHTSGFVEVRHQLGQKKIDNLDGAVVSVGMRYHF